MSKQEYLVKIDTPCARDWNSMRKEFSGKFCTQCSKTVMDFTQLSDVQVVEFLSQSKDKVCGRFTTQQLNRGMTQKNTNKSSGLNAVLAGILLIGTAQKVFPLENSTCAKPIFHDHSKPLGNKETNNSETISPVTDSLKNIVTGKVFDPALKQTVPFVSLLIKGTKIGTVTDLDGRFKLIIPDSVLKGKIVLEFFYIGYKKTEIEIQRNDLPLNRDISIFQDEQVLMGEVEFVKKKKWWRRGV